MPDGSPLGWPVADLVSAYRRRELSPVEVAKMALERIERIDHELHAFITVEAEMTVQQATRSEARYRNGDPRALEGVPVSVKDAFHVRGLPTTLGSLHHRHDIASDDSGVVKRLRDAGAVFTGKTNTAEFGQSATTDNLLGPDTGNPWDPTHTSGGSSGGAAASVASGMSTLAVGSDGGGSIRIPAAFCGLFGLKPTRGRCPDEGGFRAMTDFVSPGPLAWRAADARPMLQVLAGREYPRRVLRPLVVGYCARPENRAVHSGVVAAADRAAALLEQLGHQVVPVDLPLAGWNDVFGPLVLEDEARERGHLLSQPDLLTEYERRSLEAARRLDPADVELARRDLPVYRQRISDIFLNFDVILTPSTAVPAFGLGRRPRSIEGHSVDALWGAFPFAVPFNVAGTPAATTPSGLVDGLPVGVQLVTPMHTEALLLEVVQALEEAIDFDRHVVLGRWHGIARRHPAMTVDFAVTDGIASIVLDDIARRNALGFDTLAAIVRSARRAEQAKAAVIVLSATGPVFSAGADFNDLTGTSSDIDYDTAVARATSVLRRTHIPVLAAVNGPCLGAAVDLVVSADLVVASTAARFEVPAVRLGILYNPEALAVMHGRLGGALTRRLMLGISLSATEAAMVGMVARVVEGDQLAAVSNQLALQLRNGRRGALGATKELLNQLDAGPVHLEQWTSLRKCLLDSSERHQAIAERKRSNPS